MQVLCNRIYISFVLPSLILNSGKYFEYPPTIQPATKVVATALAVAFSLHLLELKFIYSGQIFVGTSTAPMIGFVPLVF